MSLLVENYLPPILEAGFNTNKNAAFGGTLSVTGAITLSSASLTGAITAKSATAVPATAGAVAAGAPLVLNSNGVTFECTTDAPTHTRVKGSICININGSSSSTRMYVNTDGAGTWTSFTTAA